MIDAFRSFNDSLLIINDNLGNNYKIEDHANIIFINKENGEIKDSLSSKRDGIIQTFYNSKERNRSGSKIFTAKDLIFDGTNYYVADISSDTIYKLTTSRDFKPFMVRKPSVFETNPAKLLDPVFKTNNYLLLVMYEYTSGTENLQKLNEKMSLLSSKRLFYDLKNDSIFETTFYNIDYKKSDIFNTYIKLSFNESDKNYGIINIPADKLIEGLSKNELSGKLKEVALNLKEDDNPVLMIIKFKN